MAISAQMLRGFGASENYLKAHHNHFGSWRGPPMRHGELQRRFNFAAGWCLTAANLETFPKTPNMGRVPNFGGFGV